MGEVRISPPLLNGRIDITFISSFYIHCKPQQWLSNVHLCKSLEINRILESLRWKKAQGAHRAKLLHSVLHPAIAKLVPLLWPLLTSLLPDCQMGKTGEEKIKEGTGWRNMPCLAKRRWTLLYQPMMLSDLIYSWYSWYTHISVSVNTHFFIPSILSG